MDLPGLRVCGEGAIPIWDRGDLFPETREWIPLVGPAPPGRRSQKGSGAGGLRFHSVPPWG